MIKICMHPFPIMAAAQTAAHKFSYYIVKESPAKVNTDTEYLQPFVQLHHGPARTGASSGQVAQRARTPIALRPHIIKGKGRASIADARPFRLLHNA